MSGYKNPVFPRHTSEIWERGDRNPSLDTIDRIAKTFGITLSELLNEDETVSYVTASEKELLDCYRSMPQDRSDALLAFLKTLS